MENDPFVPESEKNDSQGHQHEIPIADRDRETLEFDPPESIEETEAVNIEFDEADALFAKRTGIKDGHGRY
jgi:hypothetical protein